MTSYRRYNKPYLATSFFTTFTGNESPLSEGGAWNGQPAPTTFTNPVQKNAGKAFDGGTATGTNDAIALVNTSAFTPTDRVRITATFDVSGTIGSGEIELHFNMVTTATTVKTYEVDTGGSGIFGGVRWNGAQADVVFMTHVGPEPGAWVGSVTPVTGDKLVAERTVSGGTVHINVFQIQLSTSIKTLIWQCEDNGSLVGGGPIYTTGQPGIGFDGGSLGGGTNGNFALTDFLVENF